MTTVQSLLPHLREIVTHNLSAAMAVVAALALVIYVQFVSHAFRVRRHSRQSR